MTFGMPLSSLVSMAASGSQLLRTRFSCCGSPTNQIDATASTFSSRHDGRPLSRRSAWGRVRRAALAAGVPTGVHILRQLLFVLGDAWSALQGHSGACRSPGAQDDAAVHAPQSGGAGRRNQAARFRSSAPQSWRHHFGDGDPRLPIEFFGMLPRREQRANVLEEETGDRDLSATGRNRSVRRSRTISATGSSLCGRGDRRGVVSDEPWQRLVAADSPQPIEHRRK
jgi:hypothetical protein